MAYLVYRDAERYRMWWLAGASRQMEVLNS